MKIKRQNAKVNLRNHYAALALYFAYYNFVRIHIALRITHAMESGLTDHVWTLRELLIKIGQ
jgi:hypothetical protein